MKNFTKADLRTGYYVQLVNLEFYIYIDGYFINEKFIHSLKKYDDNLFYTRRKDKRELDVYKVFRNDEIHSISNIIESRNELLFERKQIEVNRRNYEKLHRKLWKDIADGKVESKRDWIDMYCSIQLAPNNDCFACAEAKIREKEMNEEGKTYCDYCPITDADELLCCAGLYSEYEYAIKEKNPKEKRKIAAMISDLPWNKNAEDKEENIRRIDRE